MAKKFVQRLFRKVLVSDACISGYACLVAYAFECVINYCRVLEVVVGEQIDLVEKVPDIDATKRVHLRERKNAGEARQVSIRFLPALNAYTYFCCSRSFSGMYQLTLMTLSYSSGLLIGMGI